MGSRKHFRCYLFDKIWIGDGDRRAAWLNTAGKQVCRFETENQVLLQLTRNGKMLTVSTTGKRTWFEYDSLCNIKAATVSINKDAESAFAGYFDVIRSPFAQQVLIHNITNGIYVFDSFAIVPLITGTDMNPFKDLVVFNFF
jgi:hypothetical protein